MLVEVEILPPPEDENTMHFILLSNPGPFLMVHNKDNEGMKTKATAVRILSKTPYDDEWHVACPASMDSMGSSMTLQRILDHYTLLPNEFRIILTQRI